MITEQTASLILAGGIILAIIVFCSVVIVKRFVSKEMINAGSQYVGQNIYMQYQNADSRQAIEEIMYKKEDERRDAFIEADED
ncbi:MAG: hypothetical protein GY839_08555 [candidate division Zixibacteria bacterium]|nr:hypothetical protein [candidate division Zixibacteria bacterium]